MIWITQRFRPGVGPATFLCGLGTRRPAIYPFWALSDKCEPVSEWPVTVALCRTKLAPLGESGGSVKLEIGT